MNKKLTIIIDDEWQENGNWKSTFLEQINSQIWSRGRYLCYIQSKHARGDHLLNQRKLSLHIYLIWRNMSLRRTSSRVKSTLEKEGSLQFANMLVGQNSQKRGMNPWTEFHNRKFSCSDSEVWANSNEDFLPDTVPCVRYVCQSCLFGHKNHGSSPLQISTRSQWSKIQH